MKLSVVLATHNRRQLLPRVVGALVHQTLSREAYEVILVDDGSTDGTDAVGAELARTHGLRCIRQANRGPAAARNRGLREARGEIVAFTDDDCLVPADWLERLAGGYARHPEVAGVGGRLVPSEDALAAHAAARYELFLAREIFGAGDAEVLGGFECPAGGTNNMSYRRSVLEKVEGFDEGFPPRVWGEDADLKWRVTRPGRPLLYVPVAVVHLREYSLGAFLRQSVQRGRGEAHFRLKHRGRRGVAVQLHRLAPVPIKLLLAPLRRDPGLHAVAALSEMAKAAGCLLYRRPRGRRARPDETSN